MRERCEHKENKVEYTYEQAKTALDGLITSEQSFVIFGLTGQMLEVAAAVEKEIEAKGLKCRVYTRNRGWAAAAASFTAVGIPALVGIAAHNIATYDPDYEIGKDIGANKLYVDFKK
jgi:hypothetical protein